MCIDEGVNKLYVGRKVVIVIEFTPPIGPDHEPKNPKNIEAKYLETFMNAKPGRKTMLLLTNRMTIERCIAPIKHHDNSVY